MEKYEVDFLTLSHGAAQVTPAEELKKLLKTGKKLKIKLGMDPTAPNLHLGHAVVLSKMKQFQDLGHEIIFVIGDFTAGIGDPTGKSKTRPPLDEEQIALNTATYFDQVSRILNPEKMTIRFNSSWLGALSSKDVVKLCAKTTLARLTERDDFTKRIKEHVSIGFHELLYPLFQAYDSVELKSDVELGGTDQTFNLLFGRFIQEQYGQKGQVILTTPILEGLDGTEKMSKSLGNTIDLQDKPDEAFGKLMSISDALMWRYLQVLLDNTEEEISIMQERIASGNLHPMNVKKDMAFSIVKKFWSEDAASSAQEQWEALFQKKDYSKAEEIILLNTPNPIWIVDLLKEIKAVSGSSEAKRLIESGAVSINQEKITDFKAEISWQSGTTIRVGKHRIYAIK